MPERYVTLTQAEQLQRRALVLFLPCPLTAAEIVGHSGVVGLSTTAYYIVPDDDPRLRDQPTPDPWTAA